MPPVSQALRRSAFRCVSVAGLVLVAGLLAACQNKGFTLGGDSLTTASTEQPSDTPSFKRTEKLAKAWEKDKGNSELGFAYADGLAQFGQVPAAAKVLRTTADTKPDDAALQAAVGKKLLSAGAAGDAVTVLERAVELNPTDWQSLSALGSAYDQKGQHADARQKYQAALTIKPGEASIRNNLAMSHALQGQLTDAEQMLRELVSDGSDAANPRIRQNLALVVGLQGRFDEARDIASKDLPPDEVEANLAYLQEMLSQPDTWASLQDQQ